MDGRPWEARPKRRHCFFDDPRIGDVERDGELMVRRGTPVRRAISASLCPEAMSALAASYSACDRLLIRTNVRLMTGRQARSDRGRPPLRSKLRGSSRIG